MAVKKVTVTLPQELYEMVQRARETEHRSRSEVVQEALRTYFGEPVYRATDEERSVLMAALDTAQSDPASLHDWADIRESLRSHR